MIFLAAIFCIAAAEVFALLAFRALAHRNDR